MVETKGSKDQNRVQKLKQVNMEIWYSLMVAFQISVENIDYLIKKIGNLKQNKLDLYAKL